MGTQNNSRAKYSLRLTIFPLYSSLTASGRVRNLLRGLSGFFVALTTRFSAALCF
jgi:hypothetical protein